MRLALRQQPALPYARLLQVRSRRPPDLGAIWTSLTLNWLVCLLSMVGLLRMHCLLADYRLALKTVEEIDLSKKVRLRPAKRRAWCSRGARGLAASLVSVNHSAPLTWVLRDCSHVSLHATSRSSTTLDGLT